ncbi:MAG: GNAT family N-acetyltransferase [Rhodospirillum sp.]|nr:GNAT family N-acetyltransferase [Rhodospirillum sp.]MCF8489348.1 GNAT family N-acetyltransferase [Rhodospirillum sp.]MCF8500704.1 GNAT family N-acetyltransferase [Rhodospirillum sp.]
MAQSPVILTVEDPDQPEPRAFLEASDAYHGALYPAESNHLLDVESLRGPAVTVLVARVDGLALGMGALVDQGEYGEVKRLWVAPEARGMGLGQVLLEALEDRARALGLDEIKLETGISQPEALALYRAHGYGDCPPFGAYVSDPLSLFLGKRLRPGP